MSLAWADTTGGPQATPLLDRYLFSTFKKAFGGRVRFIVSGGAPLSTHVEEYLKVTLCTPVFQVGYPSSHATLLFHPRRCRPVLLLSTEAACGCYSAAEQCVWDGTAALYGANVSCDACMVHSHLKCGCLELKVGHMRRGTV